MKVSRSYVESTAARFWQKVDRQGPDDCWLWQGTKRSPNKCGLVYGDFGITQDGRQVAYRAHRLSYIFTHGEIPDGYDICHSCDNPLCVNPNHLWAGTRKENMQDAVSKDRHTRGERVGISKLNEDMVRMIRASNKTTAELSEELGMDYTNIMRVRSGERWAHVK